MVDLTPVLKNVASASIDSSIASEVVKEKDDSEESAVWNDFSIPTVKVHGLPELPPLPHGAGLFMANCCPIVLMFSLIVSMTLQAAGGAGSLLVKMDFLGYQQAKWV